VKEEGMVKEYDAIIIGSGPAGMFTALELAKSKPELKTLVLERGPVRPPLKPEDRRVLTSGWGGAGTFSDGKLSLTYRVGGQLQDFIGESRFKELMKYVDSLYMNFGASNSSLFDPTASRHQGFIKELKRRAERVNLEIVEYPVRHLGTENVYLVAENIRNHLQSKGVEILVNTAVKKINPLGNHLFLVEAQSINSEEGHQFITKNAVVAPGRAGMEEWFMQEIKRLNIPFKIGGVDIGVRVETEAKVLKEITDIFHDFKFYYHSPKYKNRVRTFCVCPYGFVVMEEHYGLTLVNGHSYGGRRSLRKNRSKNTNFAILITEYFTQPFNDPIAYGRSIAHQANQLAGGKVLVQKLGDIWWGHRSDLDDVPNWKVKPTLKEAVPGDLARVIPHRYLELIKEKLQAMDEIAPGINSAHTILYFPEFKFYSVQVIADPEKGFETEISGLRVIGDGGGRTRGLVQSSMEGIIAARAILKDLEA